MAKIQLLSGYWLEVIERMKENEKTEFGKIIVNSFKLKKSVRTPQGPIYTDLFEVKSTD